ncbi:MAG: helix-turn-helix transcriptional regulator [Oscillospiraceae bacterium]|nr:helix-turn-helix transcriptional regulator [Oscillospiraceae bacterium]MBQ3500326.1 helix-turn-helix transcriptional regulator [Oscillospiraceae bacterium]
MTFGEKLSKLRKEYNYTQEQLADIFGVSRQTVSKWESDIAYPETDKLIKIGKLFECSMDYLLNEDITEKQGLQPVEKESILDKLKLQIHERKSEKMIFGMPLYHIGRNAHGFFAIGIKASGVFSFGLLSRGVFSFGTLSLGVVSIGLLSLGLIAAGVFSVGLLAVGSIALGLFAAGAISAGLLSFGALSVGCFSSGALAIGKYIAVGDHAHAMIAIGQTVADGSVYSHIGDLNTADIPKIVQWLDGNVPSWLGLAKEIFKFYIQ